MIATVHLIMAPHHHFSLESRIIPVFSMKHRHVTSSIAWVLFNVRNFLIASNQTTSLQFQCEMRGEKETFFSHSMSHHRQWLLYNYMYIFCRPTFAIRRNECPLNLWWIKNNLRVLRSGMKGKKRRKGSMQHVITCITNLIINWII